jgi:hypothetical protein
MRLALAHCALLQWAELAEVQRQNPEERRVCDCISVVHLTLDGVNGK